MKKTFEIGPGLNCDADRLVASRLLVQANSGGGKTRTLRRLLEQSHGRLQHLVIDPEGEYHTLREHFDYVLASPSGGDTVAHPRTAAMLAERLLQLNVSAILDIYELNPDQRVLFVQRFLDALVNAPRDLWHPVLIVLDEAHVYAPEGKENASTAAVKAMASRGRKRGFCLVPATQRLSKLSKDVAAECNNKLIGRCTLDVDIKRAAEELGFTSKTEQQALRHLEPGQFYGYGPAFEVNAPVLVKVGSVKSHHPEPGQKAAPVPAPTEKVKKVLQQLADLPAEAEEREKTVKELKEENQALKREVAKKSNLQLSTSNPVTKEVPALTDADRALIEKLAKRFEEMISELHGDAIQLSVEMQTSIQELLKRTWYQFEGIHRTARKEFAETFEKGSVKKLLEKLHGLSVAPAPERSLYLSNHQQSVPNGKPVAQRLKEAAARIASPQAPKATSSNGDGSLPKGERNILVALAQHEPDGCDRSQLTILTGFARSTRDRYLQFLQAKGFTVSNGDAVRITQEGIAALGDFERLPTGDALLQHYLRTLPSGEAAILRVVTAQQGVWFEREVISQSTGFARSTRDRYIQFLQARKLVESDRVGVKASDTLFEHELGRR